MKVLKENKLVFILFSAFFVRTCFSLFFSDLSNNFYFEFGEIAKNIINGKGFSLFFWNGSYIDYYYQISSTPSPSAYMPLGYTTFIFPFFYIEDYTLRNILLHLTQNIISLLTIYFLYKWIKNKFNNLNLAVISSITYAFLPEFIYSTTSIGPTIIFHFFIILFLYILDLELKNKYYILGLIFGILIYFRSEFLLFGLLFSIYYYIKYKNKRIFISLLISFLIISPWLIRNFIVFEEFVPMSTSSGLNFYRGNNELRPGIWVNDSILLKLNQVIQENPKNYEIKMNKLYWDESINFIKNYPIKEFRNLLEKAFHSLLWNYYDNRSNNLFILIPWLLVLILSLYGFLILKDKNKLEIVNIFIMYSLLITITFLALPRYQTMMKIALIPYFSYGINAILIKLKLIKT